MILGVLLLPPDNRTDKLDSLHRSGSENILPALLDVRARINPWFEVAYLDDLWSATELAFKRHTCSDSANSFWRPVSLDLEEVTDGAR